MFAFADGFIKVQLYDQKVEGHSASAGTASGTSTPPNEKVATNGNGNNGVRPDRENLTHYGAFILFETALQAMQARDRLHNMVFDSTQATPVVLQARLALKNLFVPREDGAQGAQSQKSSRRGSHGGFTPQNGSMQPQVIPPSENQQAAHGLNGHGYSPATAAVMVNNMLTQSFSPLLSPQHAGYNIHSGYHSPALSPVPIAYQMAPPALQNGLNGYYSDGVLSPHASQHPHHAAMHQQQGVFAGMYAAHGGYHRQHNHHTSHAGSVFQAATRVPSQ